MTWPTSDVVRTNADDTTDSPATFRADVLDLIDKFNLMRNHVSVFVRGLLSAADAAAARTTLVCVCPDRVVYPLTSTMASRIQAPGCRSPRKAS